jgi:class 3 adenylate cyclase
MRSDARAFVESQSAYLERVEEIGDVDEVDLSRMEALDTTVLFQEVDTEAVRDAFDGGSEFVEGTNYLDEEVYSFYSTIESESFDWVVIAEASRSEIDEPLVAFIRDSLVLTAVFVVIITFAAVAWANSFVRPLQIISAALVRIREGDEDVSVPATGALEFRSLADSLDHMVGELDRRKQEVATALEAKVDILRTLLPPAAAERVGRGDRRLVDTVPQATAVALVIEGLDDAFKGGDTGGNRDFVHAMVDEIDASAVINGLERVKISGDVYYAVCGLSTPYVDHAPRSVSFAVQARNTVRRVAAERGLALDIAAGINSGPITTGLVGGSRLVYDLWGDTVEDAYVVARAAQKGDIVVTAATRDRTPAGRAMEPMDLVPGVDTWRVDIEARGGDDS